MSGHDICCVSQFLRSQKFAFSRDNFGPLFALGLGLLGHGPLHALGQFNVFYLHHGNNHAPALGVRVQDFGNLAVDGFALAQYLVQLEFAHNVAHRGLGNLVDGGHHVLNGHNAFYGIHYAVIGHG